MRFNNNEYSISPNEDWIAIRKDVLERWRDHYLNLVKDQKRNVDISNSADAWKQGLYMGKADSLIEILKHFEEMCV